jgi:hypothetical protein
MNTPALLARLQSVVALGTQVATTLLGRWEELPGFGFSETMAGTIRLGETSERRIIFRLRAAVPQLAAYLRDGRTTIVGDITIDGLAKAAPVEGSLWIWPHRSIIRYEFTFRADDGRQLVFTGQKDLKLLDFRRTITTLPAALKTAEGEVLGEAVVYFALADLPSFVRSFHPVHSAPLGPAATAAADVPASCPAHNCHP